LSTANYYSGTSGLVLPVPNKTHYPEEYRDKSRLSYYASLFTSIEVNSSFYKIPRAKTIENWAAMVPDDFKFTFKLWKGITHAKELAFDPQHIAAFMQAINPAGSKKGCLLVQLPPGAKAGLFPQLQQLIAYIRENDPQQSWKIAMEFRHQSWYNSNILQFAGEFNLSIVLQDIPVSATPMNYAEGNTVYLRFHGPGGKYRGSYQNDILMEYSTYIKEWLDEGKTVYVYFNNTMGDAVKNLASLDAFVQETEV